jgi:hypothetical protein
MKKTPAYLVVFSLVLLNLYACKKQGSSVPTAELNEYMPVSVGKYIRYQLDSTRFVDFGQRDTVVSYDAKDIIEAALTDNAGRPMYRVVRYLRNLSSTNESDYTPNLTYSITPTRENVEISENNLRFLKLKLPVAEGFYWHGNSYLPPTPFYEMYQFSNDEDIDLWEYTYEGVDQSAQVGANVYDNTVTVLQVADSSNVPIEFPEGLAYRNYWTETYAKNIGLIYKEVVMWEYQPPNSGNPGFRSGFGLKMTIIDHN